MTKAAQKELSAHLQNGIAEVVVRPVQRLTNVSARSKTTCHCTACSREEIFVDIYYRCSCAPARDQTVSNICAVRNTASAATRDITRYQPGDIAQPRVLLPQRFSPRHHSGFKAHTHVSFSHACPKLTSAASHRARVQHDLHAPYGPTRCAEWPRRTELLGRVVAGTRNP